MSHYAEVLAERIHDLHATIQRQCLERFVISYFRQGVIEYLVKSLCGQLLGDFSAQFLGIGFDAVRQTRVQFVGKLHIVVAVYTQYIFHHVALALYIYAVTRDG